MVDKTCCHFIQMVSLAKNPFMWDRDKVGSVITPTISSLKLVSGDKRMEIKNLSKGNEIVIEILTPSTPVVRLQYIFIVGLFPS